MKDDQLVYRAKAYYQPGKGCNTILYSGHTTRSHAEGLLDGFLSLQGVTGGQLEYHAQGVGWVLASDDTDEIERRRIDGDVIFPHTYS